MLRNITARKSFSHSICYLTILITAIIIYSDISLRFNWSAPSNLRRRSLLILEVSATSINYGISQQPITDIQQLMPKLCQNQSVICEGSFCIPGVKKCVCDLRMPVQISRFCLRQIDIDTKCFATNQCNHTVKDAVCVDINSRTVLDAGASKSRLEQWHQLNELKKSSQSTLPKEVNSPSQQQQFQGNNRIRAIVSSTSYRNPSFPIDDTSQMGRLIAAAQSGPANARNSPYEINYDTPELLHQNHTRRRTNNSDRMDFNQFVNLAGAQGRSGSAQTAPGAGSAAISTTALPQTTSQSEDPTFFSSTQSSLSSTATTTTTASSQTIRLDELTDTARSGSSYSDAVNRKKITIKTTHWPPGVCSCPIGFMFDAMLRKCLALSLADSHCQVDADCKQIASSHCSPNSRKCECDEPFVWDQKELACTRPKQSAVRTSESTGSANIEQSAGSSVGFLDSIMPPLVLAKLMPDYTMILIIFVALVIIGTLVVLSITVRCFSSNSSALISPKNRNNKKKPNQNSNSSNLHTRSPYATLRRPDHKQPPGSQLSNFTQVTRGRILNYDFEQESPSRGDEVAAGLSPPPGGPLVSSATLRPAKTSDGYGRSGDRRYSATLRSGSKGHRHHGKETSANHKSTTKSAAKREEFMDDTPLELNDNISLGGHQESESKSDSSNIVNIPGPPPTQQPPYMLKNPMRGQSSAIAAAAAAVANKRLQKKNFDQQQQQQQQQQQSNGRITTGDGSPVFL